MHNKIIETIDKMIADKNKDIRETAHYITDPKDLKVAYSYIEALMDVKKFLKEELLCG